MGNATSQPGELVSWIVLEGVDGSGKSTLAAEIQKMMPRCAATHLGPPVSPESALDECLHGPDDMFLLYHPDDRRSIVSDRLHWGCPVYGPIYRPAVNYQNYGDFGRGGWRYAELFVASRGGITVLVDADPIEVRQRLGVRGDDYVKIDDIEKIITSYRRLANDSMTLRSIVRMSIPKHTIEAAKLIVTAASKAQVEVHDHARFPSYIGPPKPRVLVVTPPANRPLRLDVLADMSPGHWQRVGFTNRLFPTEHYHLVGMLGNPPVALYETSASKKGEILEGVAEKVSKRLRLTQIVKEMVR